MPKNHNHSTTLSEQLLPFYHKNKPKKPGFTTIELLLTVAIILVLATIGAPLLLNRGSNATVIDALNELELLCICAQHHAYASNEQQVVTINTQKKLCTLATKRQSWQVKLPASCRFGFIPNTLGPPADPVGKVTQAVTFPYENKQFRILFEPTGIVSAGSMYIIDKDAYQQGALTCGVSQVSYIRKYVYNRHSWQLLKT